MDIGFPVRKQILYKLKKISIESEKEVCGYVINNEFLQKENIHPDPFRYFVISPNECIWAKDAILFHSHPLKADIKGFSEWDLENQFYFQIDMLLYSVKYNRFYFKRND